MAIVGPSGGGKTTLCNLIPRFYDVSEGKILLDGVDVKHYTLKSLRRNIGIVQQEVYLFSGTVYENILYRILVLTEDGIVEEGNHEELLAQKGIYYKLYHMAEQVK